MCKRKAVRFWRRCFVSCDLDLVGMGFANTLYWRSGSGSRRFQHLGPVKAVAHQTSWVSPASQQGSTGPPQHAFGAASPVAYSPRGEAARCSPRAATPRSSGSDTAALATALASLR